MAIDVLQDKIRKRKNALVVDFSLPMEQLPPHLQGMEPVAAFTQFCKELMAGLKGKIAGVRFSFGQFALMGDGGLSALSELLTLAHTQDYYVLLDSSEVLTPWAADRAAAAFFGENSRFFCDGLIVSPYIGTDAIKPFVPYCKDSRKDLFMAVRTPNKSAAELQDLLTGTRLVHTAAVDLLLRQGESILGRCGYSHIGALACAGSSLSNLRTKYKRLFLLVDGYDYPSGNAKNASLGFDGLGHGAAICVGPAVTAAWLTEETDGLDYAEQAVIAAERIQKNIVRYVTIM